MKNNTEKQKTGEYGEGSEIFDVTELEHPTIEKYRPDYLGRGGGQIVYELRDHPNSVVKVSKSSIKSVIDYNLAQGSPPDFLGADLQEKGADYLRANREKFLALKKTFGENHALNQRQFIAKIPITPEILNDIYGDKIPSQPIAEVWTVLTVQRKLKDLRSTSHFSMSMEYWRGEEGDENSLTKSLINQAMIDEKLRRSLRDFLEKAISFSEQTGEMLDVIGRDNVVFIRRGDGWDYVLIDVLLSGAPILGEARRIFFEKLAAKRESLNKEEKMIILNAVSYVRFLNRLAEKVGSGIRLSFASGFESFDFSNILREI